MNSREEMVEIAALLKRLSTKRKAELDDASIDDAFYTCTNYYSIVRICLHEMSRIAEKYENSQEPFEKALFEMAHCKAFNSHSTLDDNGEQLKSIYDRFKELREETK